MSLTAALLVVFAGLAVGATSIGGILVVPILTTLGQIPVREAIAASNFSFAFTGAAALLLQQQRARGAGALAPAQAPAALYWAALAGAAAGALTLPWLPPAAARMVVALLALVSGVMALLATRAVGNGIPAARELPHPVLIGFLVGCGSAWSGTGGPVLLLPVLLLARAPTLLSVAAAQGMQLPIAGASSAVNLVSGQLNLGLGVGLGVLLLAGWFTGARVARHIPVAALRIALALGLIVVGLWYGLQTVKDLSA